MEDNKNINPALLVTEVQNNLVKHVPDRYNEAALNRINSYTMFNATSYEIIRLIPEIDGQFN